MKLNVTYLSSPASFFVNFMLLLGIQRDNPILVKTNSAPPKAPKKLPLKNKYYLKYKYLKKIKKPVHTMNWPDP